LVSGIIVLVMHGHTNVRFIKLEISWFKTGSIIPRQQYLWQTGELSDKN
jgi:hypothetical protein